MPGKKKKKMTPEERMVYEEQKRLEEEEARKKKQELFWTLIKERMAQEEKSAAFSHNRELVDQWRHMMRDAKRVSLKKDRHGDRMAKEEKSTAFSHNKLVDQWRHMMRDAKRVSLKKDVEALSQTFERAIDRQDATVRALLQSLAESEEQYAMAFRSHLQNIDRLVDLQKRRLQGLEDDFQSEQEVIREEFDTERAMLFELNHKEMNDLADILFAIEEMFQEREDAARMEFQSLRDELKNKCLEDKHALRMYLEQKVDDLWQQFRQALQNYNETTEERKTAFETLKLKDEKSAREIELQMRKLQRISDQIASLKAKMVTNARESEERNKLLREQRERMQTRFQAVKKQVNAVRASEREKLTKLTLESNAALKELRRKKAKGEQILRLAHLCRKLETEEEKVVPFYVSSLTPEEQEDVEAAVLEAPSEPLAAMMHDYTALENFWKRYNKVLLEKLALEKEKQTLLEQNCHLRRLLKDYLDGVSVNDDVLTRKNTLMIVNYQGDSRLNLASRDPRIQSCPPEHKVIIEAVDVLKNILP